MKQTPKPKVAGENPKKQRRNVAVGAAKGPDQQVIHPAMLSKELYHLPEPFFFLPRPELMTLPPFGLVQQSLNH